MIPCQYRFLVITVTSYWVQWRLKSSASLLFTQPFIQAQIKKNIRAPHRWPLCRELTNDRCIPRTNGTITRKMFPFDDVIMVCYKSKPQLWLRHWRQLNYVFKRRTNNATEHMKDKHLHWKIRLSCRLKLPDCKLIRNHKSSFFNLILLMTYMRHEINWLKHI